MKRLAAAFLALAALAPVASAGATTSSLAGLSAARVLATAMAAARAAGSCLDVSTGAAVGYRFSSSTQSGPSEAREVMSFNKAVGDTLLLHGQLYVKESATIIELQFGKRDPRWANRWIHVPASSHDYTPFSRGLTFASMLSQVPPTGALHRSAVETFDHHRVVAVTGSANAELGLTRGAETLFVSAQAPFRPVEMRASGRLQGVPTTLVVVFSQWGRHFSFATPSPVTALAATDLP